MRYAILSDIHGNFRALQAVLEDIAARGVDEIISLGDNIGYGPEPEEVVRTLMERNILSVMGNHELALASPSTLQRLNPSPRQSLEITRRLMGPETLAYSLELPVYLVRHDARFVHGSPPASITTYLWDPSRTRLERLFTSFGEPMGFFGHTHQLSRFLTAGQSYRNEEVALTRYHLKDGDRHLINPGSVGQPRDGINNRAKYGIWDRRANTFEFRAVIYDVAATVALLRERNFPEFNAMRLA